MSQKLKHGQKKKKTKTNQTEHNMLANVSFAKYKKQTNKKLRRHQTWENKQKSCHKMLEKVTQKRLKKYMHISFNLYPSPKGCHVIPCDIVKYKYLMPMMKRNVFRSLTWLSESQI